MRRLTATEKDALRRLRVLVLCGGPGVEREVSLESGANVANALAADGFAATLADVRDAEDVRRLRGDVVVPMLHGEFGEDGEVQRVLEEIGLPYCGSGPAASALALDKAATKERLRAAGVPTPDAVRVGPETSVRAAWEAAGLGLPVVVKPNARGSSVGVRIVRDADELEAAGLAARAVDPVVLVEGFVAGRELTASLWNGEPLPLVELNPDGAFYDYHAKYRSDKTAYQCPAALPAGETERLQAMAAKVFRILSLRDLARVDILMGAAGPMVLEANTAPGFTAHSLFPMAAQAAGWTFAEVCAALVAAAAEKAIDAARGA